MAERPYVGVTGATSVKEVDHLVGVFTDAGFTLESSHLPTVGFLVSQKTLYGQPGNLRYPPVQDLRSLLEATGGTTFNTLHYNSSQGSGEVLSSSESDSTLAYQIAVLFNRGIYSEGLCQAVQLNIVWPPPDQIKRIRGLFPDLKVILQLSQGCLVEPPTQVVDKVGNYADLINYILIDPSSGKGQVFSARLVLPFYQRIKSAFPEIALGFGGGFTGENIRSRLDQLVSEIGDKNFSVDAEGGLRDKRTKEYGDDDYNPQKVEDYINAASVYFIYTA